MATKEHDSGPVGGLICTVLALILMAIASNAPAAPVKSGRADCDIYLAP